MIPAKVVNRLQLGRDVAARVDAPLDSQAWVYVHPEIDPATGAMASVDWGKERYVVSINGEDPIKAYTVRHVEMATSEIEKWGCDYDYINYTVDETFTVHSLDELSTLLLTWLTDLTELHTPVSVRYLYGLNYKLRRIGTADS